MTRWPLDKKALRLTLYYLLFGAFWIIASDHLVALIFQDREVSFAIGLFKGIVFVLLSGGFIGVLLFYHRGKITKSKEIMDTMQRRYQALFEKSPVPMWVYDPETFEFLEVNEAAEKQYGYSRKEFLAMTTLEIRPESEQKALQETVAARGFKENKYSGVWKHQRKNGEIIYVDIESNYLKYDGRDCRLVLATNISEIIKSKEEMEAVTSQLNNFVYRASHDLRGPIARIIGLSDLLLKDPDPDLSSKYKTMIHDSALLMDKMLKRLLSVNALNDYQPHIYKIELKKFIEKIVEGVKVSNDLETFDVKIDIPNDLVLKVDPKILTLALENVLDNCIKYRNKDKASYAHIKGSIIDGALHLEVRDNGIGIEPKARERIFDLFFRGAEESQGSGLGLFIARKALEKQSGALNLNTNNVDETVFEITLPEGNNNDTASHQLDDFHISYQGGY